MKPLSFIRQRLGLKLFLSYLVIIIVAATVLIGTAEFVAPEALNRHVERMQAVLGDDPELAVDLMENFDSAIKEILSISIIFSLLAAVVVSLFTARRIIGPIQVMKKASHKIAEGDYHERIPVHSSDELGTLALSFNQMAVELEGIEQRRLDLIGNVAHELRTPLSTIKSTMEGLVDEVLPAQPETFINLQREVSRLQRLVQDLEELSRVESGQISLVYNTLSLNELLQSVLNHLRNQYEDKGVNLTVELSNEIPLVRADPNRLTQVFLNLFGNALQYTPSGGQVTIRTKRVKKEIVIQVHDTGIGILAEHLPYVFDRFYRVEKSRSRVGGGSGIGLTIAKHLVEAMGGKIWVESAGIGQGSLFVLSFPITP